MKKILLPAIVAVLLIMGCGNQDNKHNNDRSTGKQPAAMLKDLGATTDIKTVLCQDWENKEDAEDAANSGGGSIEMPYRGFSFFNDLTVVQNPRDAIQLGTWNLAATGKLITITYADGSQAQYKIASLSTKKMILLNTVDQKQTEYRSDGKAHKNITDDPFYGSNNQWRKKPMHMETDSAVKLRMAQCIVFYLKFLEDNLAREGKTISFAGLPAIFKWYSGGIGVTRKENLEQKWINCFYNKEQAYKAQTMLEDIITKKYKWDATETSWVKQDVDVMKQIYDTLLLTK